MADKFILGFPISEKTASSVLVQDGDRVGIGTDSPATILHASDASGAILRLERKDNNVLSGELLGGIETYRDDDDGAYVQTFIKSYATEQYGRQGYMTFGTNDNNNGNAEERMRIDSGGDVQIKGGATKIQTSTGINGGEIKLSGSPQYDLTINGLRGQILFQVNSTNQYVMDANQFYPEVSNSRNLGTSAFRWSTVFAVNGVNTSDETLKENIKDCNLGIDFIDSLKPKSYNLKDLKEDNDAYGKKRYGLIAQDILQTELKDSVFGEKDGEYGLSYNDLIAPMIKAIQELKAEVELLKLNN